MIKKENRSKVYLLIIVILLITNITLLSFLLMNKNKPHSKRPDRVTMISGFLKNEIGFDSAQVAQYISLSNSHKENMKKLFDSLRSSKDKQFTRLAAGNFSDSTMDAVASQSATNQKMVEMLMFNHLKNIRNICKPNQLAAFDSLFARILNKKMPTSSSPDSRKKTPK